MITVFYGNQVYGQYANWFDFKDAHRSGDVPEEIWQSCYYYTHEAANISWWRSDQTPVLESDVPPQLKAWVLLLT